ncbi:hypothetical protein [Marinicauda sp. Alg238-R41]|uniref:hypothetical protein n=1 Tax=Marinicauda sp. Alg238-R41 TaxID=2993447 RepID=UPI0022E8B798|nr:hypothetical protein [Marinicauda sp. Alg238-R41]
MTNIISVLTYKSVETILAVGGTQSWALDRNRAARCRYVVICRNAKTREPEGPEPHGTAFLVGKIRDVVPSSETEGRWLIQISEYALIDAPDQWEGRNPVAYWPEDEYEGIDFEALVFRPLETSPLKLTIAEAKAGLAHGLNVDESAIEIVIRG